jgi:adenosylmethionine-8-amino-7-oxononanoate aminotransferase
MDCTDSEETQSPSEAVLYKIADQENIDAENLNHSLVEVIDPDALDELFRGNTGSVSFEYHGYLVTVDHSGKVSLQSVESERG